MAEAVEVGVSVVGNTVHLAMREKDSGRYATGIFAAENARQFSEMMANAAYEAHHGRPPPNAVSALQQDIRTKATDAYRELHLPIAIKLAQSIAPQAGADAARVAVAVMDMVLGDRE